MIEFKTLENPSDWIVVFHESGRVEVNPRYSEDEISQKFWEHIKQSGFDIRKQAIEECAQVADFHGEPGQPYPRVSNLIAEQIRALAAPPESVDNPPAPTPK